MGRKPYRVSEINLSDILYIDEGILKWRIRWGKMRAGDAAGAIYGDRHVVKIRGEWYNVEDIIGMLQLSDGPQQEANRENGADTFVQAQTL